MLHNLLLEILNEYIVPSAFKTDNPSSRALIKLEPDEC